MSTAPIDWVDPGERQRNRKMAPVSPRSCGAPSAYDSEGSVLQSCGRLRNVFVLTALFSGICTNAGSAIWSTR